MQVGMVYLVGAGPGDYRLLSLKAVDLLKSADCVVYDRLADNRILQFVKPEAERIYVGKASSDHTLKQEEINELLAEKALEGKTVVRLKGGDPFVFGRGGEEALHLLAKGVRFEIVPGVTSAIAVPAYAGIPVTHRHVAASFAVITGHEDPNKENSSIHWDKLATAVDTLVFLMGVENLPHITTKLMEYGRSADTPVALVRWGTKLEQEVLETTLGNAAEDVKRTGLKPPAVFIVGDVVNLRKELRWFDNKPLFGKKILVTRARAQASVLITELEQYGAACIEAPTIKIVPPDSFEALDKAIQGLSDYNWTIFTSVNGVEYFFGRLYQAQKDARAFGQIKVAAIGVATAQRLKEFGIIADLVPVEFTAEGILAALEGKIAAGDKILIPRAEEARNILPDSLRAQGLTVDVITAYKTVAGNVDSDELRKLIADKQIDLITFTSSSTVTNLLQLLGPGAEELVSQTATACIGPVTAATCLKQGINPTMIAEDYTIKGLVETIIKQVGGIESV